MGKRADCDVKVSAAGGRLFIGNSYATAACDAVVLEPGAFWIQRTFLEKVLRSFHRKEIIVLEADSKRLTLGRFSCGILNYEPAPEPPAAPTLRRAPQPASAASAKTRASTSTNTAG